MSFQEGVDGYSGTADTILNEGAPDADNSANTTLIVDLLNNVPESEVKQVLLRFDGIFGSAAGQIPLGSTISSATLGINVTNTSDVGADLYRMLEPWSDIDSWSDWGNGIDTDDLEAASVSESGSPGSGLGAAEIDVTADLQAWSDGDPNHGWVWMQDADDSWQFDSSEDGTATNRPVLTVRFTDPDVSSIAVTVSQSSDDAEELVSGGTQDPGNMSLTSTDLEIVTDGVLNQLVGIRFAGVAIPAGAVITAAYIDFEVDETSSGTTSVYIHGEATDDATTFTDVAENISTRPTTSAWVDWSPGDWNAVDAPQATSDISPVVQEIVDRAGWSSGNALAFIIGGIGTRVAKSYDFDSGNGAPMLVVEYTLDPTISVSGTPLSEFSSEPVVPSDEQSYSVVGRNLTEDITVTAPADFEVSLSSGGTFGPSVALPAAGGDVFVRMNAASEGTPFGDIEHTSAGASTVNVGVSGSVVAIPDVWVAYNDMNTLGGAANPPDVTDFDYSESGSLVDSVSGTVLPVTVSGTTVGTVTSHPDGGPVANPVSDASLAFDEIVDLAGTDQLETGESATLTFSGLESSERYSVTLSANRYNEANNTPGYPGERWTRVTIDGVAASTADSSTGVVVNPDGSVSFSIGDNSQDGNVARWIDIDPGPDGEFTVTSEWDEAYPGTKGYAMAAFMLETYSDTDVTPPAVNLVTPADGASYNQGDVVTIDYSCGDLESNITSCDGPLADGSPLDTSTLGAGIEFTVNAENGAESTTEVTHTYDIVEAPTTVEVRVNHDDDDAEEDLDGTNAGFVDLDSSDLEFVRDLDTANVGDQMVGMRFQGVGVPQGATITAAYLEFTVDELDTIDPTVLWISGEDVDDALRFEATSANITSRTQTAADALWEPDAWTSIGGTHQSSDISRVVQEIVDRGGWASGNAMALFVNGEGQRIAEAHDSEPTMAPLLHVEYVMEPVPLAASFQQGIGGYAATVDTFLDATATPDDHRDDDNSTAATLIVDLVTENHILLRFDDIFGGEASQVPAGSTIEAATIEVNVTNSGDGAVLHRMLQPWKIDEAQVDSWNSWVNGIQADGAEAEVVAESSTPGGLVKTSAIDVTADLQAWADGATNYGWAFLPPTTDDSWRFDSAEGTVPPLLTVDYFPPDEPGPENHFAVDPVNDQVAGWQWPAGGSVLVEIYGVGSDGSGSPLDSWSVDVAAAGDPAMENRRVVLAESG